MARRRQRRKSTVREYKFKIDAYSPETMPLMRLSEYLRDLSVLFGEDQSVHLVRIEEGSTVPVLLIEREAEPKIRERLENVQQEDAPVEAKRAVSQINERLRKDNAKASIVDPVGSRLLAFPGRDLNRLLEYGPFNQPGTFIGIPIRIGGEEALVPVHLEGRQKEIHICRANRTTAKEIARYLFSSVIKVEGSGRWIRHRDGRWELVYFTIKDFEVLPDKSLRDATEELRSIPAEWKRTKDPLGELKHIRQGTGIR